MWRLSMGPYPAESCWGRLAASQGKQTVTQHKRCSTLVHGSGSVSSNNFKKRMFIEVNGEPLMVMDYRHVKPGKGAAFVKTKVKNANTGAIFEQSFRAGESVQLADVETKDVMFSYIDAGNEYVFMDSETYEEYRIPKGPWSDYVGEGCSGSMLFYKGTAIDYSPPQSIECEVVDTEPALKGGKDRAQAGTKPATLNTGAVIQVPTYIERGERIVLNTYSGEYSKRVTDPS